MTRKTKIAFLGPRGTFTEMAARKAFNAFDVHFAAFHTIRDIFMAVEDVKVEKGVVPIENSTEGSVNVTLDFLYRSNIHICGEIVEPIRHSLIVGQGARIEDIRVILSHQQAIAQCRQFLADRFPDARIVEAASTADAVRRARNSRHIAAIGSAFAAELYGMRIVFKDVGDTSENFTRFVLISKEDVAFTGKDKTSIVFSTKNLPGALYRALEPFADLSINLSKIESRPTRAKPWEYIFFMDFDGHRTEKKCSKAISRLEKLCSYMKILGSYPKSS